MATKRFALPGGQEVDVEIIDITNRVDDPLYIELADGARLRLRVDVLEVGRAQGTWDPEGNPMYHVKSVNIMTIEDCPENLKRPQPAQGNGRQS